MKDDNFTINILVNGFKFPLGIARSDEEIYRNAEKLVGQQLKKYQQMYPQRPTEEILSLVAFQIATFLMKKEHSEDTDPLAEKIQALDKELEALLKKE